MIKNVEMKELLINKIFAYFVNFIAYGSLSLAALNLWIENKVLQISDPVMSSELLQQIPMGWSYTIFTLSVIFWAGKIAWSSYKSWFLDRERMKEEIRKLHMENDEMEEDNKKKKK